MQNRPTNRRKFIKNEQKSDPKRKTPKRDDIIQHKSSFFRFFQIFGRFLISKMDPKSMKKRAKIDLKIDAAKHARSDAISYDLARFSTSFWKQNRWEMDPRPWRSRETKNLAKHWQGQQKSRFELPNNYEKSFKKRFRRRLWKNRPKNSAKYDFRSPWGSFWEPNSKDFAKFFEACFATPWDSPRNRLKSAGLRSLRLSPWSFKGLGLLDRPSSP